MLRLANVFHVADNNRKQNVCLWLYFPCGERCCFDLELTGGKGALRSLAGSAAPQLAAKADELARYYATASARVEADRAAQMALVTHAPSVQRILETYFDMQHHALIDNVDLQVRIRAN